MEEGLPLMIENMGENIDAVLDQMVALTLTLTLTLTLIIARARA